jgi:hypothetical protein
MRIGNRRQTTHDLKVGEADAEPEWDGEPLRAGLPSGAVTTFRKIVKKMNLRPPSEVAVVLTVVGTIPHRRQGVGCDLHRISGLPWPLTISIRLAIWPATSSPAEPKISHVPAFGPVGLKFPHVVLVANARKAGAPG